MASEIVFAEPLQDFLHTWIPVQTLEEVPIVVSLCYYSFTMVFVRLMRLINTKCSPTSMQLYVGDMITAFQMCACSLENAIMRRYYGTAGFCVTLFCLGMWYTLTIENSRGNPCGNIVEYARGKAGIVKMFARTAVQLAGGLLSYRYARSFWQLSLTKGHADRFANMYCMTDLTVSMPAGLTIEFFGTFIEASLAITAFTQFFLSEATTKVMVSVVLTLLGVDRTGMYLNPVNASNQTFSCHGLTHLEHIIIYWIAPICAAAFAVKFNQVVSKVLSSVRKHDAQSDSPVESNGRVAHDNVVSAKAKQSAARNEATMAILEEKNTKSKSVKKKKVPTATLR